MTARSTALLVAVVSLALVAAQDVVPLATFFHTWQYAAALAIAALILLRYLGAARRDEDGVVSRRLVVAIAGALVVIATGLASGLLGPDTQTVVPRAPGTITPLPDLGAAAFFPLADANAIARGETSVVLRRRDRAQLTIAPGARRFVGASVLLQGRVPAVYVDARNAANGEHVTVTQPTGSAFLSPVLLFRETAMLPGFSAPLPTDAFATPALHRTVKALLVTGVNAEAMRAHNRLAGGAPAVLFIVDDDAGRAVSDGIGLIPSGEQAVVGGLLLRPTVGSYPSLLIASAPAPLPLALGGAVFLTGIAWAAAAVGRRRAAGAAPDAGPGIDAVEATEKSAAATEKPAAAAEKPPAATVGGTIGEHSPSARRSRGTPRDAPSPAEATAGRRRA